MENNPERRSDFYRMKMVYLMSTFQRDAYTINQYLRPAEQLYQQVLDTYVGEREDEIYEMDEYLRAGPWVLDPPGTKKEQGEKEGEAGLGGEVYGGDVRMQGEDDEVAPEGVLRAEEKIG